MKKNIILNKHNSMLSVYLTDVLLKEGEVIILSGEEIENRLPELSQAPNTLELLPAVIIDVLLKIQAVVNPKISSVELKDFLLSPIEKTGFPNTALGCLKREGFRFVYELFTLQIEGNNQTPRGWRKRKILLKSLEKLIEEKQIDHATQAKIRVYSEILLQNTLCCDVPELMVDPTFKKLRDLVISIEDLGKKRLRDFYPGVDSWTFFDYRDLFPGGDNNMRAGTKYEQKFQTSSERNTIRFLLEASGIAAKKVFYDRMRKFIEEEL